MAGTDVAPVLGDGKLRFGLKRMFATFTGGIRLAAGLPCGYYFFQIFAWLLPALVGVPLTVCIDLSLWPYATWAAAILAGGVCVYMMVSAQIWACIVRVREARQVHPIDAMPSIADDDEDDDKACCSSAAINVVMPQQTSWIGFCLHICFVFVAGAGAVFALIPSRVTALYGSAQMIYILFLVIGWFNVCASTYAAAFAHPTDPNQYHSSDVLGLSPLTRIFYVDFVLIINFLTIDIQISTLSFMNYCLQIAWLALPLLWFLGMLAQPDVLIEWMLEQTTVYGFGGTAAASLPRLLLLTLLAWTGAGGVYVLMVFTSSLWILLGAACIGAFLSHNLLPTLRTDLYSMPTVQAVQVVLRVLRIALTTIVAGGVGVGMYFLRTLMSSALASVEMTIHFSFAVGLTAAWALAYLLQQLQQPFLFGLVRNCMLPSENGWGRKILRALHAGLLPLLSVAVVLYVTLYTRMDYTNLSWIDTAIEAILLCRALRQAWQVPRSAALAVATVAWVTWTQAWPQYWPMNSLVMQLLIVGAAEGRFVSLAANLKFLTVTLLTACMAGKQRPRPLAIVFSVMWLPFSLVFAVLAAGFQAPFLPFLGLPIFLMGYPRSRRHWPLDAYSNGPDASFYQQLVPEATPQLQALLDAGQLGDANSGDVLLLRHQSLVAWLLVLERGNGYAVVRVAGLEQQETSCHHAEAVALDEMLDASLPQAQAGCNPYPLHVLSPLATTELRLYSANTMTLTGLLSSPERLAEISEMFYKALVWLFVKHRAELESTWLQLPVVTGDIDKTAKSRFPYQWYMFCAPAAAARVDREFVDNTEEITAEDPYFRVMVACYAAIDVWGLGGLDPAQLGLSHVHDVFSGRPLPSVMGEQLFRDAPDLRLWVLDAYRMGVKAVFDQAALGPAEGDDKLEDMFIEMEKSWYLGADDAAWQREVSAAQRDLFTVLKQDHDSFAARVYTVGTHRLASFSGAVLRGLWASLALELYYFTNDDDERYSIQAHTHLLRNLAVQAAAPPLGYPVFVSAPLSAVPPV